MFVHLFIPVMLFYQKLGPVNSLHAVVRDVKKVKGNPILNIRLF